MKAATQKKIAKIYEHIEKELEALQTIADEMHDYYDERSEKWQESENGEAYYDEMETVDNVVSSLEDAVNDLSDLSER